MPHDETNPHPLGEGEFIHFEYLHFDPDDPETGFSNMVEVTHDHAVAAWTVHRLTTDPKVWAIHVRRIPQPEQDVHLYDETQHLAKAQNVAFRERKRAETLQKLLGAAVESNHKVTSEADRAGQHSDVMIEALNAVIARLAGTLEIIQRDAKNAQRDAYMLEPGEVYRMAKVDVSGTINSELRAAKRKSRAHMGDKPVITDEAEQSPDDMCTCGHERHQHYDAACQQCSYDVFHEFKLAVL